MVQVSSIQTGVSFADTLADWLLSQVANPLAMADVTVWVPSPRQARAVHNALAEKAGGSLVLPNIKPFHLSEDDVETLQLLQKKSAQIVINPQERLILLARQVRMKEPDMSAQQVMNAAQGLASLFDRLTAHNISFDALHDIVPESLATHWEHNLSFLKIVTEFYPLWLEEKGAVDAAQASKHWLLEQAKVYRDQQPQDLVVAAGFADTTPTGLQLLSAILNLPNGTLILPGFDKECAKELEPTHPQYGMSKLLEGLGFAADHVSILGMQQAPQAQVWRAAFSGQKIEGAETNHLTLVNAQNAEIEAGTIALAMREVLEEKNKTCALVTPDRKLARRVAAALKTWQVDVDDSAGVPLDTTPLGRLFLLFMDVIIERFRPVIMAEFIRHPLVCGGLEKAEWKRVMNTFNDVALRGAMPFPGLGSLGKIIQAEEGLDKKNEAETAYTAIEEMFEPLLKLSAENQIDEWVNAHIKAFESAVDTENLHDQKVFDGLSQVVNTMRENGAAAGKVDAASYMAYIKSFLQGITIRPRQPAHPRLFIWGPLEARLQKVNRVIIGGTNEGAWPGTPTSDMWLNRTMQAQLGLPLVEAVVGLNAHDFQQLASYQDVIITRTVRDENGETLPSRFLSRLQMVLSKNKWEELSERGEKWISYWEDLQRLGELDETRIAEANPPIAARPKVWSASFVKTLMQCPYKAYARYVLHLKKPSSYEEPADAADRGQLIHECLQAFFEQVPYFPAPWSGDINKQTQQEMTQHLLRIGEVAFKKIPDATARAAWWPRFEKIAEAFIEALIETVAQGRTPKAFEEKASLTIGSIKLQAIADRVDASAAGQVVIDYKTGGQLPQVGDTKTGKEPQLAVEGLLASEGGYGLGNAVASTEYWHLKSGGDEALSLRTVPQKIEVPDWLQDTREGIEKLESAFMREAKPYAAVPGGPTPTEAVGPCRNCDYAGICRFKEWVGHD